MNAPDPTAAPRRGQRQLLLLAAMFFVPLAVAFWLYYGPTDWRPVGGTNKGDLIDPAVPLPDTSLADMDGLAVPADLLRGKWTMLFVGDGACDERCRKLLYLSRQSRIALNKDMDRVQRVFLATSGCCDRAYFSGEHPDLTVVLPRDEATGRALLAAFPGTADAVAGRLYLVDPLGNLVLSYSAAAPDESLLTDVRKLLRLSHIG